MNIYEESMQAHLNLRGKLEIRGKVPLETKHDLSLYYSPGVGAVAAHLAKHPKDVPLYTSTNNTVAVISDGSAVLGLGNIGPEGALPVMEGKAMLFKQFAGIDAVPLVLNTQDPDEVIETIVRLSPSFGGINLEDIAAPNCFYIENELKKRLHMPIMHDDQHGTAIVVVAGLTNALQVVKKQIRDISVVVIGAGAAGSAVAHLMHHAGAPQVTVVDSKGAIYVGRDGLDASKKGLALLNKRDVRGSLEHVLRGADVVVGVSKAGLLTADMVRSMAPDPIVFALANPDPEIMPDDAKAAGAAIIATGRSDFPNQINNVLAFPGIFRGALDTGSPITESHKVAAAEAIAGLVTNPTVDEIVPDALDERVVPVVAAVFSD